MKHTRIIASAAALCMAGAAVYAAEVIPTRGQVFATPTITGDINGDGSVNSADASLILAYYAYASTTSDSPKKTMEEFMADRNKDKPTEPTTGSTAPTEPTTEPNTEPPASSIDPSLRTDGDVFTIVCWHSDDIEAQLRSWLKDQFPQDGKVDLSGEYVGVKTTAIDSDGYSYERTKPLTTPNGKKIKFVTFETGGSLASDYFDKFFMNGSDMDVYYAEPYWIEKYANSNQRSLALSRIGITDEDAAINYKYADDLCKDKSGVRKAAPSSVCPGAFAYRTDVAKYYLGVNSPAEMQEAIGSWEKFTSAATTIAEKSGGSVHLADSYGGLHNAYFSGMSKSYVKGSNIVLGDEVKEFADMAKKLWNNGGMSHDSQWTYEWTSSNENMGYFTALWSTGAHSFLADETNYTNSVGKWAVVEGPAPFYWGATCAIVNPATDNADDAASFMKETFFTQNGLDIMSANAFTLPNDASYNKIVESGSAPSFYFAENFGGGTDFLKAFRNNAAALKNLPAPTVVDDDIKEAICDEVRMYFLNDVSWDETATKIKEQVLDRHPQLG